MTLRIRFQPGQYSYISNLAKWLGEEGFHHSKHGYFTARFINTSKRKKENHFVTLYTDNTYRVLYTYYISFYTRKIYIKM